VNKPAPWITMDKLGNFEPEEEPIGDGPGEGGKPYKLPPDQQNLADESIGEYGMNMAVSNVISLERAIPDTRMSE
jgi:hypothetical protein